jgi:hypothetical protein
MHVCCLNVEFQRSVSLYHLRSGYKQPLPLVALKAVHCEESLLRVAHIYSVLINELSLQTGDNVTNTVRKENMVRTCRQGELRHNMRRAKGTARPSTFGMPE